MSLNRRACRPFLARLQPGKFKYAWTSDDTLISALRPFLLTRSCRRHVGLAPGPLEARKRATRRRLMGLAPSGTAPPTGDIASHVGIESWLFGRSKITPQTYQWQEPSAPIRRQFKKKGIFTMLHLSISKLTRYLRKGHIALVADWCGPGAGANARDIFEKCRAVKFESVEGCYDGTP